MLTMDEDVIKMIPYVIGPIGLGAAILGVIMQLLEDGRAAEALLGPTVALGGISLLLFALVFQSK